MLARLVLSLVFCALAAAAAAQDRPRYEKFGKTAIVEVPSSELATALQIVKSRIAAGGFGGKWEMASEVLNQDAVVAEEIVFQRGRKLVVALKNNETGLVLFIAPKIRVAGPPGQPVVIQWDKTTPGVVREPVKFGKASNGLPGDREGADGKPGADGVQGNRGLRAADTPAIVLVAQTIESGGKIQFQLEGQDGGTGGPGQDGGDGGPGRAGRPGILVGSSIGVPIKQTAICEPAQSGGNGGRGGNGGTGGLGAAGGDGGDVLLMSLNMSLDLAKQLIDPDSSQRSGKGGPRGPRGLGGQGGPGAPLAVATASCAASPAGRAGDPGRGRDPDKPPVPDDGGAAPDGNAGTVVYTRMTESQARAVGLLPSAK